MKTPGWTSQDFAGFIKSPKKEHIEKTDSNGKRIQNETRIIEGEYDYSLRYDEFMAPLIKVVQIQHEEINELKQKLNQLEQLLSGVIHK